MSVYVGIDVHRKRSQVAVVAEDGTVLLNKNTVNGTESLLRLIGDLPAGTPAAFEAAFGWGWLVRLPRRCSRRQACLAAATRRRKFRSDPAYPAARTAGSSRLAEIRPCVFSTRSATRPATPS
jgi:hypothetical protein